MRHSCQIQLGQTFVANAMPTIVACHATIQHQIELSKESCACRLAEETSWAPDAPSAAPPANTAEEPASGQCQASHVQLAEPQQDPNQAPGLRLAPSQHTSRPQSNAGSTEDGAASASAGVIQPVKPHLQAVPLALRAPENADSGAPSGRASQQGAEQAHSRFEASAQGSQQSQQHPTCACCRDRST